MAATALLAASEQRWQSWQSRQLELTLTTCKCHPNGFCTYGVIVHTAKFTNGTYAVHEYGTCLKVESALVYAGRLLTPMKTKLDIYNNAT